MHNRYKNSENKYDIKRIIKFYDNMWNRESDISWGYEQRRIHSTIFKFLKKIEADIVIEVGCGQGDLTVEILKRYKKVMAFDISFIGVKKAIKRVNSNCNFFICDATKSALGANVCEIVISSEVLEHIIDQKKCLEEIYRVIKPNGYLLLSTPNPGGIHQNIKKVVYKLLQKPYSSSQQILDNPLSPIKLKQMLLPYFTIEKKKGLIYSLPFLQHFGLMAPYLISIFNRLSEFIEKRDLFPNLGIYQCLLCKTRKTVN